MSGAIASLLGALVGGLAAIGGAWLQARNTARLQRGRLLGKRSSVPVRRPIAGTRNGWTAIANSPLLSNISLPSRRDFLLIVDSRLRLSLLTPQPGCRCWPLRTRILASNGKVS